MSDESKSGEQIVGDAGAKEKKGHVSGVSVRKGAVTSVNKAVAYSDIKGRAMFEGDIYLGPSGKVGAKADGGEGIPQGVAIAGEQYRWRLGVLAYEIDPALPDQKRITDAIAHWKAKTKIQFVERTAANKNAFPDYVRFIDGGGCWSAVGRRGGMQELSVGASCTKGNVIHEIGHALGLWHEQSREDRAKYVTINFANVIPQALHNFNQHVADGDDLGPYDYKSIMHYPKDAFTRNGQPTIEPTKAGAVIGQRDGLSEGDRKAIAALYAKEYARRPKVKNGGKSVEL